MTRHLSYPTLERIEDTARGTAWSQKDTQWLWENYTRFPINFLAEELHRSNLAVRLKIHRLKFQRADRRVILGNNPRETMATIP